MPNDDLGTFPLPPQPPINQDTLPDSAPTPVISSDLSDTPQATPTSLSEQTNTPPRIPTNHNTFEETPEELPSTPPQSSPTLINEQEKLVDANENLIAQHTAPETPPEPTSSAPPEAPTPPTPSPATLPRKTNHSISLIIIIILVVIAGAGLATAAYLSQQTASLKTQLEEITQTLEKQKTIFIPTPSPTVFEALTPTPNSTSSGSPAQPTAAPTTSFTNNQLQPLANASSALKVAINHSPNAQLILIKEDHTTDLTTAITKYFFREDLTTKKYFYVAITGTGSPETIDKQIYVTPDDNIPSLNDAVLSNKLGLDLDEALKLTYTQCANQEACTSAPVKAQYIKTGSGIIWQISLYTKGTSVSPLLIQINAETKAIIYKSPEFANK